MALKAKSLFLYGFEVTAANQYVPFLNVNLGSEIDAIVPTGFYSLGSLAAAIAAAMNSADTMNTYTVTVDRTTSGGTQNRITIATSGSFLSLLFNTGTQAAASIRDLISFGHTDQTGATTYTNSSTAGTALEPDWFGNNYTPPDIYQKNFGSVTVATDGTKEGITWSLQRFIAIEFKWNAQANVLAYWNPFLTWAIQQKPFEFTPEITSPSTLYSVTLETTPADGKGLAWTMKEQIGECSFFFTTGPFVMRVSP